MNVDPSMRLAYVALVEMRKNLPHSCGGLCNELRRRIGHTDLVERIAPEWPEFSGNKVFPVPGWGTYGPAQAFMVAEHYELWNPEHPYGAARLRLLDWMIEQLEAGYHVD